MIILIFGLVSCAYDVGVIFGLFGEGKGFSRTHPAKSKQNGIKTRSSCLLLFREAERKSWHDTSYQINNINNNNI